MVNGRYVDLLIGIINQQTPLGHHFVCLAELVCEAINLVQWFQGHRKTHGEFSDELRSSQHLSDRYLSNPVLSCQLLMALEEQLSQRSLTVLILSREMRKSLVSNNL
jgi:hypothetical protein